MPSKERHFFAKNLPKKQVRNFFSVIFRFRQGMLKAQKHSGQLAI